MIATTMQRIPPPSGRPPEINLAPRDVAALADELNLTPYTYIPHVAATIHDTDKEERWPPCPLIR